MKTFTLNHPRNATAYTAGKVHFTPRENGSVDVVAFTADCAGQGAAFTIEAARNHWQELTRKGWKRG